MERSEGNLAAGPRYQSTSGPEDREADKSETALSSDRPCLVLVTIGD